MHVDIGSMLYSMGILSLSVPTTFIDIRPIPIKLPNLEFKEGTILELPYKDNSLNSVSSLCVIEHIGLGRYGDPLDSWGTEKASTELSRVLSPGGDLYVSVPIDDVNKIYFNAHRAFNPQYVKDHLFPNLELLEESYIYKTNNCSYDPKAGLGVGLYHFTKPL